MDKKILIVDDDASFSGVLKEVLELEGYSLIAITQVGDIVSVVKDLQPDLVLLDLQAARHKWWRMMSQFAALSRTRFLTCIAFFSAYSKHHLPMYTIPFSVFIPKPFDLGNFSIVSVN